jgi:hypothetical protein
MCNKGNAVKRFYVLLATQMAKQSQATPLTPVGTIHAITVFKNPVCANTMKHVADSYIRKSNRKELFSDTTQLSVVPIDIPRNIFFP